MSDEALRTYGLLEAQPEMGTCHLPNFGDC
jgi:hypothetical protein